MSNVVKNSVIFVVGAAIGSVATWSLLKKAYEQRMQEAIDEVKEVYSKDEVPSEEPVGEPEPEAPTPKQEKPKNSIYENMVSGLGYIRYDKMIHEDEEDENEEAPTADRPYVISPEQYGELEDYDCYEYTYYADKVLTDETDHPLESIDEKIGLDSLNRFGEYEPDSVYVRNDKTKSDYAILLDTRTYEEVLEEKPYLRRS